MIRSMQRERRLARKLVANTARQLVHTNTPDGATNINDYFYLLTY